MGFIPRDRGVNATGLFGSLFIYRPTPLSAPSVFNAEYASPGAKAKEGG